MEKEVAEEGRGWLDSEEEEKSNEESSEEETFEDVEGNCFDTHCHLQLDERNERLIYRVSFYGLCIMSEEESQWQGISEIAAKINTLEYRMKKCVPAFGIHPWRAHLATEGWQKRLVQKLKSHPNAILGEMGLDKIAKTRLTGKVEFETQIKVWEEQLYIAGDLKRPVSMHCVQAFGFILEFFRGLCPTLPNKKKSKKPTPKLESISASEDLAKGQQKQLAEEEGSSNHTNSDDIKRSLPPIIVLHSYGGSVEIIKSLLAIEKQLHTQFYFGFSSCINSRSPKTIPVAGTVPDDRILLETDTNTSFCIGNSMSNTVKMISKAKNWSLLETSQKTLANSLVLFSFSDKQ